MTGIVDRPDTTSFDDPARSSFHVPTANASRMNHQPRPATRFAYEGVESPRTADNHRLDAASRSVGP